MPRLSPAYPLRTILNKAWAIARSAARRFNAPVRSFLAEALRQIWHEQKTARAEIEAMKARVLHSIATLPDDLREMERQLQAWYAKQAAVRPVPATVVLFPAPRPAVVPAVPVRRAA